MLQDTSFAIHPEKNRGAEKNTEIDIGNIINCDFSNDVLNIQAESGYVHILFYTNEVVQIVMNPFRVPEMKCSPAVVLAPEKVNIDFVEKEHSLVLNTSSLRVEIQKKPLRISISDFEGNSLINEGEKGMCHRVSGEVLCYKEMVDEDHFYGFGEKTGFLNKRGEKLVMWNSDVYAPHNPETDSLYESIPYFMTLRNGRAHGVFFDNTFKSTFDFRSSNSAYSFSAEGGQINYYVMAGPDPKSVLEQYTQLTGRAPIPPKWALGYHQSRYSYGSEEEVRKLVRIFKEKDIPVDAIHFDIHYMDGYRVFTFDRENFPNPRKLIEDLKTQGIRVVPIVDPGVKEDPEYDIYTEGVRNNYFCKYVEGDIYFGDVWPGKSAFPDFTNTEVRKWWGEKHAFYADMGIEGIWNDMNEPAVFNETKTMDLKVIHDNDGDPKTHRELHNLYGLLMGEATYEGMKKQLGGKRPFLLTRAGFSGVQRYAAVWTGDNRSFWEHLQMSLPMVMNMGLSGIAFTGPDVGGFAHDTNGELLARWTQVGAFTPYFRNHSALGFVRQEPWSFGEKYEEIIRKYIRLRYEWMPQLYTQFALANKFGTPVMRPLLLEYPSDKETYNLFDQFMIGDNVIVAPIMQPTKIHRDMYLPEGVWVDYWTGEELEGGRHHLIKAELDKLPIYIKQGTMIALAEPSLSTEFANKKRMFHLYYGEGKEYNFKLYEDDGVSFNYENGELLWRTMNVVCKDGQVTISEQYEGNYESDFEQAEFIIHGPSAEYTVQINGQKLSSAKNNTFIL